MGISQPDNSLVEPSREDLVALGRKHVLGMEHTDAAEVWFSSGMEHLLLTTIGRRSGRTHKVALPYWCDDAGHRVVVASFAGAPRHPAWYFNLLDRDANPVVEVRLRGGRYRSVPEKVEEPQYQQLWQELTAERTFYRDYQKRCERRIPLIRLPES